jgi:cation:H+ antiporter
MTAVLLMGMLRREKKGIANIGFESFLILVLYVGAAAFLLFSGNGG